MKAIRINTAQARELAALLDELSVHVETAIETNLRPSGEPMPEAFETVELDRAVLKRVRIWERFLLSGGRAGTKP